MNPNNYTTKSQEAIAESQQIAFNLKHSQLETFHLLKAMLDVDQDVLPFLFKKSNADIKKISNDLETLISKQATVSGDAMKYPSQALAQTLLKAILISKNLMMSMFLLNICYWLY